MKAEFIPKATSKGELFWIEDSDRETLESANIERVVNMNWEKIAKAVETIIQAGIAKRIDLKEENVVVYAVGDNVIRIDIKNVKEGLESWEPGK